MAMNKDVVKGSLVRVGLGYLLIMSLLVLLGGLLLSGKSLKFVLKRVNNIAMHDRNLVPRET